MDASVPPVVAFSIGPDLPGPDVSGTRRAHQATQRHGVPGCPHVRMESDRLGRGIRIAGRHGPRLHQRAGTIPTTNTRLTPLQRLPEHTAVRSVLLVRGPVPEVRGQVHAVFEREPRGQPGGRFRWFKAQRSVLVKINRHAQAQDSDRVHLGESYATTMDRFAKQRTGTAGSFAGGIKWYECNRAPAGRPGLPRARS